MRFEYKVVPAPEKGERVRGLKTGAERFAHVIARVMNEQGADGWEFLRTETLACTERKGLTRTVQVHHTLLVFRRTQPGQEASGAVAKAGNMGSEFAQAAPQAAPQVAPVHAAPSVEPPRPVPAPATGPRLGAPVPSFMRRAASAPADGTGTDRSTPTTPDGAPHSGATPNTGPDIPR